MDSTPATADCSVARVVLFWAAALPSELAARLKSAVISSRPPEAGRRLVARVAMAFQRSAEVVAVVPTSDSAAAVKAERAALIAGSFARAPIWVVLFAPM